MTASGATEHYGLSQYESGDKPTYTGDYNSDMAKIDAAIHKAAQTGGGGGGGLETVSHTGDLTGDGTADSPLGVAETIARAEDIPSLDGYATAESVAQSIAAAIADRLTALNIKAGNAISVSTSGNDVTISYTGGGAGGGGLATVAHDTTLTGDGTGSTPLGVVAGQLLKASIGYDAGSSTVDMNDIRDEGVYCIGSIQSAANKPDNLIGDSAFLFVVPALYPSQNFVKMQILVTRHIANISVHIYARTRSASKWGTWTRFVGDDEFNAISARVDALEQALSQSTPSTTGLTATQLDNQWAGADNILRTGNTADSNTIVKTTLS